MWRPSTGQSPPQSTYIPRVEVSVPSSELGPPHPLSRKRVCTPPPLNQWRGEDTRLWVWGWGSPNGRLEEMPSTLPTLWWVWSSPLTHSYQGWSPDLKLKIFSEEKPDRTAHPGDIELEEGFDWENKISSNQFEPFPKTRIELKYEECPHCWSLLPSAILPLRSPSDQPLFLTAACKKEFTVFLVWPSAGILEQSYEDNSRVGIGLSYRPARAQIFYLIRSPRIDSKEPISARLCSLAERYDNPIPTRFLVPIDCLIIPTQAGGIDSWAP